jgi:hypothetical protein
VSGETNRVRLNLRIDEDVKRNFNNAIKAKFGKCRPYAGIELEREFRYFLNQGELADLQDAVDDLTDTLDGSESKEKTREVNRGETVVASHRIAENVRTALISASQDDYRSAGELAETIMYGYITDGSVIERVTQKLQRISEESQPDVDNSMGAKERRTNTIIDELGRPTEGGFTLDDLDQAIEAAKGISASDYSREQYLPRVLDELDFTWHPNNPELYVASEGSELPDPRDPTNKPLMLMDRDDKRLAIKVAAYRSRDGSRVKTAFNIVDAVDLFKGQIQKSTIRRLMREVAKSSPGYEYNRDREKLAVDVKRVRRHDVDNMDLLLIEHDDLFTMGDND